MFLLQTALHEFFHILGFSKSHFDKFQDCKLQQELIENEVGKLSIKSHLSKNLSLSEKKISLKHKKNQIFVFIYLTHFFISLLI